MRHNASWSRCHPTRPGPRMSPQEQALLDLVSHGIRGDSLSVRQTARRYLQAAPAGPEGDALCAALTRLLNDRQGGTSSGTGARGAPEAVPPLLRAGQAAEVTRPLLPVPETDALEDLLAERRGAALLKAHGLEPVRTLLLTGAPGVGKTMTAHYLAAELDLPLFSLDVATVVSSFLGRTGQNLRAALEYARSCPCVLLLDEFDAVAKRRDDPADVGELKRIVNVLLLELEQWPASGLLVAATNHPELLDRAIWRRFDRTLALPLPDRLTRKSLLSRTLEACGRSADADVLDLCACALEGASPSDLVRQAHEAARVGVLSGRADVGMLLTRVVLRELALRAGEPEPSDMAREAASRLAARAPVRGQQEAAGLRDGSPPSAPRRRKGARGASGVGPVGPTAAAPER